MGPFYVLWLKKQNEFKGKCYSGSGRRIEKVKVKV